MSRSLESRNAVLNAWNIRKFDTRYWKPTTLGKLNHSLYVPEYDWKQEQIRASLDSRALLECIECLDYLDAHLIYDLKTDGFFILKNKKIWEVSNISGDGRSLKFSTVLNTILEEPYRATAYCHECGDLCRCESDLDSKIVTIYCDCCGTHRFNYSYLEGDCTLHNDGSEKACIFCGRDTFKTDDGKNYCIACKKVFETLSENNTESETKEEC